MNKKGKEKFLRKEKGRMKKRKNELGNEGIGREEGRKMEGRRR